jgi:hypothetical protein
MLSVMSQLWRFMAVYRKFWLAPIIICLILLGVLLIVAQGSALSPFLYAIF